MTNQNKNGKTSSERLREFEDVLDDYNSKVGVDKIVYNDEVEDVLFMSEEQLKNLDQMGCNEYSYLLAQYSAVLTTYYNRNSVRFFWAENELNKIIASQYSNYSSGKFDKYELIKFKIINADSAAAALNNIIQASYARKLELDSLSHKMEMMSKILSNVSRGKK